MEIFHSLFLVCFSCFSIAHNSRAMGGQATNSVLLKIYSSSKNARLLTAMARLLHELGKVELPSTGSLPHGCSKAPKNCKEILMKCGGKESGVYSVNPDGNGAFKVYCDQKTAGGGWTVFQKRKDGSVDFFRGWNDYKNGFGNLKGEFWLGLDKIYRLTHQTSNRLRVELEDTTGKSAYAEYDFFALSSAPNKFKLSLGTYSGTAGDSMSYSRNMAFSTKDSDNDLHSGSLNCAVNFKGAWWYNACYKANLNGVYHHGASGPDGITWVAWKGDRYSAKRAEMKIKPN